MRGNVVTVVSLYKKNNWQKVLDLDESCVDRIVNKYSWVWPSRDNLSFIKQLVASYGINGIISIGCGSGLLEWLIQQALKVPIIGYEVNKKLWTSKYSTPQYDSVLFPNTLPPSEYFPKDCALLFCYYFSEPAFSKYIETFQGNLIFIIGPGEGQGTFTNVQLYKPNLDDSWQLQTFEEIRDTKDFIAAYVRYEE